MRDMEVFFDYACPYCLKGHKLLKELLPRYPQVRVTWRPCESHPRPERYGMHSDLCIRGMFFAKEQGVDLLEYHDWMYRAVLLERVNVEDLRELADYVDGPMDGEAFYQALAGGAYTDELSNANQYAFEQSGVWVVPAFRMGEGELDAVEDVGVTKRQLEAFLRDAQ